MILTVVPLSERPELQKGFNDPLLNSAWPAFMLEDPIANLYFGPGRFERYQEYVIVAFDPDAPDEVLGRGCSVPFYLGEDVGRAELPDGGWDTVVRWADQDFAAGRSPNAVSALEITLHPRLVGQGFSGRMVEALKANAGRLGFNDLYAPVRPSQKHLEPATPMQDYMERTRPDGLPFDPWLRVHVRLGGEIVKVAPYSMTIPGTLGAWRAWTGLPFEHDGLTEVPGALVPVFVSLAQQYAVYVEPNVWVRHRLS